MSEGFGVGKIKPTAELAALAIRGAAATATGVVDTAVIRYTAAMVTDNGGSFTLVEAANEGSTFTCVRSGIWSLELFGGLAAAAILDLGISVNAAASGALDGSPTDFAAVDAGAGSMGYQAVAGQEVVGDLGRIYCARTLYLSVGDVLRFCATAGVALAANNSRLFLTPLMLD